jgi:hypothetical protein
MSSPSPSTRVTKVFEPPELLVFLLIGTTLDPHEELAQVGRLVIPRFGACRLATGDFRLGRYFGESATPASGWMLLRLRSFQNRGRMHKNVRTSKVRDALVGNQLRETQGDRHRRNSGSPSQNGSSRSTRTGQQLTIRLTPIELACDTSCSLRVFRSHGSFAVQ